MCSGICCEDRLGHSKQSLLLRFAVSCCFRMARHSLGSGYCDPGLVHEYLERRPSLKRPTNVARFWRNSEHC